VKSQAGQEEGRGKREFNAQSIHAHPSTQMNSGMPGASQYAHGKSTRLPLAPGFRSRKRGTGVASDAKSASRRKTGGLQENSGPWQQNGAISHKARWTLLNTLMHNVPSE
jgi:hypothetical protein